ADQEEQLKRPGDELKEKDKHIIEAKEKAVVDFKSSPDFEEAMWAYRRSLYRMARYHYYQMMTSAPDGTLPEGFNPQSCKGLHHWLEGFAMEVPAPWDEDAVPPS